MDSAATSDGTIRIGLVRGPVQSFSEEGAGTDILAPDRAGRAGLDYLALGDWHGQIRIGERTWYSGTPEPDRFKHDQPGQALLVALPGPGALPQVTPVETGSFGWTTLPLHLLPGEDAAARAQALLPPGNRRHQLLRIAVEGRTQPAGRAALEAAIAGAAPEFALLELDIKQLATEIETADLDGIDHAGALRAAAETLLAESADPARSEGERATAAGALMRLFSLSNAVEPHP